MPPSRRPKDSWSDLCFLLTSRHPLSAGHIGGAKKFEESGHLIMAGALANPVDGGEFAKLE